MLRFEEGIGQKIVTCGYEWMIGMENVVELATGYQSLRLYTYCHHASSTTDPFPRLTTCMNLMIGLVCPPRQSRGEGKQIST